MRKIARFSEVRPGMMLAIALLVTAAAAGLSSKLELHMHTKNLMPQEHPMVQEFDRIIEDYKTASMIIVAARGEERELKQFAEELAPKIEAMREYIQRVDYKVDRDFLRAHGFMLMKAKDLKNTGSLFEDLSLIAWLDHLNDNFEKTYVQDEESISTKEKENNAVAFLDGLKIWLEAVGTYITSPDPPDPVIAYRAAERLLLGDEYFISQDKDMLLIFAQPAFTVMDVPECVATTNQIDQMIAELQEKYPSVHAGTTGSLALQRDEMEAVSEDMYITSIIAMVLILGLFILSFRMWVAPLLAAISLIVGIIWTAGFAALTVGSLNLMTSMFSVILIGLGVDFSIHIISVYTENRAAGFSIGQSLQNALLKSGNGVIIGSLTTASAFLTLTISESAGMSEFGIVAGSGVVFCMLAAILVLPAMLSLRDHILQKLGQEHRGIRAPQFQFLGSFSQGVAARPKFTLAVASLVTALMLYAAMQITFDYNYLNMEPVGLTSLELQHQMEEEFDATPDFALVTASSVEEARRLAEAAKDLKMIGMVTSISDYVPSEEQQRRRIPLIREIRRNLLKANMIRPLRPDQMEALIAELYRIEDNVIELAQLAYLGGQDKVDAKCKEIIGDLENPENTTMIASLVARMQEDQARAVQRLNQFNTAFAPKFREIALGMASIEPISVETLPQNILDQYVSKDGDKYLVTIYPREQVWNLEFLERFTRMMQELDPRVTGVPPIFYILMDIIAQDGKVAAMLTIFVVFLLLFLDFRRLQFAALAMVPLLVGAIWMVGLMQLFGLQLTLMNVIGLPLILGIGIDDGVHILHRFRVEGNGRIHTVFTSTGKAIMLTSLTTMLAFGSLLFATYRGLGSLGIALFIGVGACFLSTVILLPALLGLMDKKKGRGDAGPEEAKLRAEAGIQDG